MRATTGMMSLLFLGTALPMCGDATPPSRTEFRDDGAPDCGAIPPECLPEPPTCEPPCAECKGGVIELTLRYLGEVPAEIEITAGPDLYDLGVVAPNEEFTIQGMKDDGKFENNNLDIWLDGVEQAEQIHVSCSQPIGPGLVFGVLEVVASTSKDNGPVCPAPDCLWCGVEDDQAEGVSGLAFRYTGAGAELSVHNGNLGDAVLFDGVLADGDLFELLASDIGTDKLKNEIRFYDASDAELLGIHTSCSQPLVPGTVYSTPLGDFELLAGTDKNGAAICPLLPSCEECGFGENDAVGVSSLELVYSGPSTYLAITNLADPTPLFAGDVIDGDVLVLSADTVGQPALANSLNVFLTPMWVWTGNFPAHCTAPLGPGRVIAMPGFQLTVIGGEAVGGAGLCPYDP